jgi:hypothetical protein
VHFFSDSVSGYISECVTSIVQVVWVLIVICILVACFFGVRFKAKFGCSVQLSYIDSKKVPIVINKLDWFICVSARPVYVVFGSVVFVGSPLYISFNVCW